MARASQRSTPIVRVAGGYKFYVATLCPGLLGACASAPPPAERAVPRRPKRRTPRRRAAQMAAAKGMQGPAADMASELNRRVEIVINPS